MQFPLKRILGDRFLGKCFSSKRERGGLVLHSEHFVQLRIEDCHARETGFSLDGEAWMDQLLKGDGTSGLYS